LNSGGQQPALLYKITNKKEARQVTDELEEKTSVTVCQQTVTDKMLSELLCG